LIGLLAFAYGMQMLAAIEAGDLLLFVELAIPVFAAAGAIVLMAYVLEKYLGIKIAPIVNKLTGADPGTSTPTGSAATGSTGAEKDPAPTLPAGILAMGRDRDGDLYVEVDFILFTGTWKIAGSRPAAATHKVYSGGAVKLRINYDPLTNTLWDWREQPPVSPAVSMKYKLLDAINQLISLQGGIDWKGQRLMSISGDKYDEIIWPYITTWAQLSGIPSGEEGAAFLEMVRDLQADKERQIREAAAAEAEAKARVYNEGMEKAKGG
jgi:hypothetical protein